MGGRSKCRSCLEQIEKGEIRVGMEAWIMGRQAITWQHPKCFLHNIKCDEASNARGKCKVTGEPFSAGDVKIGCCSHTATSWVSLASVPMALGKVLLLEKQLKLSELNGFDGLPPAKQSKVAATFLQARQTTTAAVNKNTDETKKPKKKKEKAEAGLSGRKEQPELGQKTGAKGKAAWRFGGHLCFGVLLAGSETKTHCYARTHKGNTKTLAKGKDYWWLLS